jgi:ring-1,2-phenylacetyl-CoA epoxidase subunit PaaB
MTDQQPPDRGPEPASDSDGRTLEPWEVFRREKDGEPMRHGGSVMAPDAVLAVHYARELYGRRQESVALWVVRRADIHDLADPDLLQPPLDRSFKKPGGYVMRDKLAAAREQSGQAKPKARSSGGGRRGAPPPPWKGSSAMTTGEPTRPAGTVDR